MCPVKIRMLFFVLVSMPAYCFSQAKEKSQKKEKIETDFEGMIGLYINEKTNIFEINTQLNSDPIHISRGNCQEY
jgi:hypothetical protein